MHVSLVCSLTGESVPGDRVQNLSPAGKPLLARYDLDALRGRFTPEVVRRRAGRSMWRFREVMPIDAPHEAVSLGEGGTPLLELRRAGPFAPFRRLLVKDEAGNPTGSFKARGLSAAITRARALGVQTVALPSAGNAGGAAAAYAARAGMECVVLLPEDTPPANIAEAALCGARVFLVNGLIGDCGRLVRAACERFGWFDLSTLKEPFRLEGKKTMGYELPFDLADLAGRDDVSPPLELPDVIFYPTGGGTGLIGMAKAFDEMEALGWIGSKRPRMVVVQAAGCAPIVRAFEQGLSAGVPIPAAHTCASGLRVPAAVGDFLMLDILRSSRGTAVAVEDDALLEGVAELHRWQGLAVCPEAGAVWKAAQRLLADGWLNPAETIVLFNTGTARKYDHLFPVERFALPRLDHRDAGAVEKLRIEDGR